MAPADRLRHGAGLPVRRRLSTDVILNPRHRHRATPRIIPKTSDVRPPPTRRPSPEAYDNCHLPNNVLDPKLSEPGRRGLQVKLGELICVSMAARKLVHRIEHLADKELDESREKGKRRAKVEKISK